MSSRTGSPRSKVVRRFLSIRAKIIALLLVPLFSLTTLWVFATGVTLGDGLNLLNVERIHDHLGYPSGALGSALQRERRLTLVYLAAAGPAEHAAVESQRLVTDRQVELFRRLAGDEDAREAASPQARQWTDEVLRRLNSLSKSRSDVDNGKIGRARAYALYSDIVASINGLQSSLSTLSDPEVARDAQTQIELTRAREVLSQEDALLSGAIAAGRLTPGERAEFTKLVGTQRFLYGRAVADLRTADRTYYQDITSTTEFARLQTLEGRVIEGSGTRPRLSVTAAEWKTTADSILTRLRGLELSATADAERRARPIATNIILRVALAGALGLAAVIASIFISVWVARSVIRELSRLKNAALELANQRLPGVVRRLRRGEEVDVAAEAPPLSFGTNEIDQVGQAFNAARRTAIQGAVEEAALRRSISEIFINLARRSQALLHRQLNLLDAMERRIAEPDELEDLFRLDHLATRMRRHAEGLIILSGAAPGRGWRNPVPVVDVLRAASAEVEDYARVSVLPAPRVALAGQAVADVIHLLAELIENATLYSPPHTPVQVSGQRVGHGFAVEIEDRGLSMSTEDLAAANERLAEPPEFDLSNSAQLGLYVVSRLAERHEIKVTLRPSPYGGTTAIVLIPAGVIADEDAQPDGELVSVAAPGKAAITPPRSPALDGEHTAGHARLRLRQAEDLPHVSPNGPGSPPPSPRGYPPAGHPERADDSPLLRPEYAASRPRWEYAESDPGRVPSRPEYPASSPRPEPGYAAPLSSGGYPRPEPAAGYPLSNSSPPASEPAPEQPRRLDRTVRRNAPAQQSVKHSGQSNRPDLPQRVRQASLAPELRDQVLPVHEPPAEPSEERSPEDVRTMLTSLQQGWLRGRSEIE